MNIIENEISRPMTKDDLPKLQAALVGGASESQPHEARCAVATGSLSGAVAGELIALWDHLGKLHAASPRHKDRYGFGYAKGLADAYTIAAEQLRSRLADANQRQPEENHMICESHENLR